MAWKILTVIAIFVIGGSCFLWWKNHEIITDEKVELQEKKDTLSTRNDEIAEEEQTIADLKKTTSGLEQETDQFTAEELDATNRFTEAQSEYSQLVTVEEDKIEERDKLQNIADTATEIENIRGQIALVKGEITNADIDISTKEGLEESTTVENGRLKRIADALVQLRYNQQNAVISAPFASRVIEAKNKWGFVVVEGGDEKGVVHNAPLDVYRGGQFLCKLIVTEVQPNKTIAEIVSGTLPVNTTVQVGDIVKSVKQQPARVPEAPTPAATPSGGLGTGSAPSPEPTPSSPAVDDPFGNPSSGGSTGSPVQPSDPFGGSDPFADDPFN